MYIVLLGCLSAGLPATPLPVYMSGWLAGVVYWLLDCICVLSFDPVYVLVLRCPACLHVLSLSCRSDRLAACLVVFLIHVCRFLSVSALPLSTSLSVLGSLWLYLCLALSLSLSPIAALCVSARPLAACMPACLHVRLPACLPACTPALSLIHI